MRRLSLVFLILTLILVACGGDGGGSEAQDTATPAGLTGDAARGEALFKQTTIGSQPGCVTCHSLEPGKVLVGPSLATIGAEAGSMVEGQSAAEYLRESILKPDAFTVEGFSSGVMPAGLAGELSDQQVADLVAFLLNQK
jgi:mono/diheme cytochrome c family protein